MASGLGGFATRQFDKLWKGSSPLADYHSMSVTVGGKDYRSRFILLEGTRYVADGRLLADLARGGDRIVQVGGVSFRAEVVPDQSTLENDLNRLCREKYDREEDAFVALISI